MRKTVMFCTASILAGCAGSHIPDNEFVYDERDAIPNAIPLPKPDINQRPVVGTKTVLVTVTHWQDGDALNYPLIKNHTLSSDPDSLQSYLDAASAGKLTLTGQVIESTSGPRPDQCKGGSPMPMSLAIAEGKKTAQAHGLDPDRFDYVINVVDCGGNASAFRPGRIIGVYGQSGGSHVYKHEFGHNLGYAHGNTYTKCPKEGDTVTAPTGCTVIGYGDTGDSVSGGATLYPANNRWYSGWLNDEQAAVIERTGLYRLGVLGQKGPQSYLINRPGLVPPQVALEYRKPTPFDNFPPTDNRVRGVWVRYTSMGGYLLNTQLDGTPETAPTTDPTLFPGKVLKDEDAGFTIKVCTTSDEGATIAVSIKNEALPTCATAPIPPPTATVMYPTRNPVVFSGTSLPGALINVRYKGSLEEDWQDVNVVSDANGRWSATLPPLSKMGLYTGLVWQKIGNSASYVYRNFELVP